VDELLAADVKPMVTLFHWDLPQALEDAGGWLNRETAERFAEYTALVALRLGDRVEHWCPVNEPNVVTLLGHAVGVHAPGKTLMLDALPVAHHLLLGHGQAVGALRAAGATSVGSANNHAPAWPASGDQSDVSSAALYDALWNRLYGDAMLLGSYPTGFAEQLPGPVQEDLETISAPLDFYGLNYYAPTRVADPRSTLESTGPVAMGGAPFKIVPVEGYERTAFDWPVVPEGLREQLNILKATYGDALPPVYITENGCACEDVVDAEGRVDDQARVRYLDSHLRAVAGAIEDGVDVRGYYTWSLLDNFEWAEGYTKRFGLVHVDFETQVRTRKASFDWYRQLIAAQ
jgi:beta-glucosidase